MGSGCKLYWFAISSPSASPYWLMAHLVQRSPDAIESELVGAKAYSAGDQLHLEVAERLLNKKLLTLTGLAVAIRQSADWGSSLAQTVIALGQVRPIDYYQTVAEVYDLPFVDLRKEPIDPKLTSIEDRPDYAERNIISLASSEWPYCARGDPSFPPSTSHGPTSASALVAMTSSSPRPSTSCGRRPSISATGTASSPARRSIPGSPSIPPSSP